MSVLRTAAARGERRPLLLVYGNRRWEDVTFREELETSSGACRACGWCTSSRAPTAAGGASGTVRRGAAAPPRAPRPGGWTALVCGPPGMVAGAAAALTRIGLPQSAIQAEGFG